MLATDPLPWLTAQEGPPAVRARRALGIERAGDLEAAQAWVCGVDVEETAASPMAAAGVLGALADLRMLDRPLARVVAEHTIEVLQGQPGYEAAGDIVPGSLRTPCDLGGFFGPYEARSRRCGRATMRRARCGSCLSVESGWIDSPSCSQWLASICPSRAASARTVLLARRTPSSAWRRLWLHSIVYTRGKDGAPWTPTRISRHCGYRSP